MEIEIPELSLVLLVGPSGAGKSTFARKHFSDLAVVSSDECRRLISDDPNDQGVSKDAFELLYQIVAKRLKAGKLTVVDATNVRMEARRPFLELAREYHCRCVAIVLNPSAKVCIEQARMRNGSSIPSQAIRSQRNQLQQSLRSLKQEGFRSVYVFTEMDEIDAASVVRIPLVINKRLELGPFDIIGDIHGCATELELLLAKLGYIQIPFQSSDESALIESKVYRHPLGRKAIFVGDLVDRGPRVIDTLRLVATMVKAGTGLCVAGNHDEKLLRKLSGKDVQVKHGLAQTMSEIEALELPLRARFEDELKAFLDELVSHYVLANGQLIVAHAGLKEEYHGRVSGRVREFALYGDTTGEKDEYGLPIRLDWSIDYRGAARVVYGHTPVLTPEWTNRTVNIDTGCVFGGALTALRYPELEFVSE